MSRILIQIPRDAANPDWDHLPDEDGFLVMKIQVDPMKVAAIVHNNVVLQAGRKYAFFVRKAKRLPEPVTQPPLQPFKVWCERIL